MTLPVLLAKLAELQAQLAFLHACPPPSREKCAEAVMLIGAAMAKLTEYAETCAAFAGQRRSMHEQLRVCEASLFQALGKLEAYEPPTDPGTGSEEAIR